MLPFCWTVQLNFKEQFTHSVTMVTIENHGDMPRIETIELEPLRKFYIVPSKPTPLEEALTYLENNLPESQGYEAPNTECVSFRGDAQSRHTFLPLDTSLHPARIYRHF